MEFHISRQARDRYQLDASLFATNGNVVFANFYAARMLAQKINQQRDLIHYPEQAVQAGQINAMGLIDEILHHVIKLYREQMDPNTFQNALLGVEARLGRQETERCLVEFTREFPPTAVYQGKVSLNEYLAGSTNGRSNREVLLEEMLLLWVTNNNPATQPFQELFDDTRLQNATAYMRVMQNLQTFFGEQPPFGPDLIDLVNMLRSPSIAVPYSLSGQLEYIRERWSELLGQFLFRLLSSLDLIKEEEKSRSAFFGGGGAPTIAPTYDASALAELETEAFSPDREWMPRLVLIAKNTYVWLDQLSKQYKRSITRLDQVPDEELAEMNRRGFSGLWLIGLWERSRASAEIKRMTGNPDAIASAYSLFSYDIAADLGGEPAYQNLRERAWQHGIRLASDMVPNHMGIDSPWLVDHPDWFVNLDYSPYPNYSFSGADLSSNPAVSIRVEDHYFDRTDAAVTFQYVDHRDGRTRYVYHGNDGTTMPWNDTAQLNYLNPVVREAVIQTILNVARRFPIIRFDAAMTLAKRHYQRLWFPEPGTGGAIPSRAEHGLTHEQFNAAFPNEFWREVVDRVAVEAPDTLLLAEAFWLMEGYFVRTLGMHRVYNSAFMNMLRNEENAKYRVLIKNTLEFDPDILKRYVNFMNNPDERTAVDQFGKGDKYFGVCTLLATLPGLPMIGHGQFEGFAEKYGMEFYKPLWDEAIDHYLVDRHRSEITPLLQRRAIFADVQNFLLFDFVTDDGSVDENVIAYSNGTGSERGLVVVHNRFGSTSGWLRVSAPFVVKVPGGDRPVIQRTLAEGLGIQPGAGRFTIARDQSNGLEFIYANDDLVTNGLRLNLNAYEYHAFLDFRQIEDDEYGSYAQLAEYLNGRGVPSMEIALRELVIKPVLNPFREIANPGYLRYLWDHRLLEVDQQVPTRLLEEAALKYTALLQGAAMIADAQPDLPVLTAELKRNLEAALSLPVLARKFPMPGSRGYAGAVKYILTPLSKNERMRWFTISGWLFVRSLGKIIDPVQYPAISRAWLDEWHLNRALAEAARGAGLDEISIQRAIEMIGLLTERQGWFTTASRQTLRQVLTGWFTDEAVQRYLGVNRYKDVLWFNKEAFEQFTWWMTLTAIFDAISSPNAGASLVAEQALLAHNL
ncbi:MAG: alpha-amylase, partial [Anaerolineae bacterium]|nr:alpha-amylase [Anaerolineae bacterium]